MADRDQCYGESTEQIIIIDDNLLGDTQTNSPAWTSPLESQLPKQVVKQEEGAIDELVKDKEVSFLWKGISRNEDVEKILGVDEPMLTTSFGYKTTESHEPNQASSSPKILDHSKDKPTNVKNPNA